MVDVAGNLSVTFRSDLNILVCRFIQPTASALLRSGYENALKIAQEYEARFWLFDLRRRGPAQAEDENWILEIFFPQLENITPTTLYFAYLVTPSHLLHVREIIDLNKLAHYSPHIYIAVFDSEAKAIEWLILNQTAATEL
ncbi:hypothetical protein AAE02nite_32330 [Adhaeribacter aerolatus]|uniref:STAS/SEC14 domain-containing protein n=1 Tax=Adhaeribacter aerolatus TaxID=670289 RepID=A0A512B0T7_9BACT|nr:hypothetical protein [Adhaeribacter aerolatus]GEO05569.1 hypothetical protein AAE02nite_32330 [Adhaeribacter aerolatus]